MFSLKVKKDFELKEFIPFDMRIFVAGHDASSLSSHEIRELRNALSDEFYTHFEAADGSTESYLDALDNPE